MRCSKSGGHPSEAADIWRIYDGGGELLGTASSSSAPEHIRRLSPDDKPVVMRSAIGLLWLVSKDLFGPGWTNRYIGSMN